MPNQVDLVSLQCSSCGADLQIATDVSQFACGSCGVHQVVARKDGVVYLMGLTDTVGKIHHTVEVSAAELEHRRLSHEFQELASHLNSIRAAVKKKCEFPIVMSMLLCGPLTLFGIFGLFGIDKIVISVSCLVVGLGGFLLLILFVALARKRVRPTIAGLEEEKRILAAKIVEKRAAIGD